MSWRNKTCIFCPGARLDPDLISEVFLQSGQCYSIGTWSYIAFFVRSLHCSEASIAQKYCGSFLQNAFYSQKAIKMAIKHSCNFWDSLFQCECIKPVHEITCPISQARIQDSLHLNCGTQWPSFWTATLGCFANYNPISPQKTARPTAEKQIYSCLNFNFFLCTYEMEVKTLEGWV